MSEVSTPTEVAVKPHTIAQAALALFSPLETDVTTLADRHRNVVFDMSTPKGFKAAKDARLELRESGRFAVQRLRDKTKDQLNDCKKVIEDEATRLIAIVSPVETFVDEQIKVHEKKLADDKAERDRIEAERKQKHLDAIAKIEGYVAKAQGLPIERIEAGLAYVREIDASAEVFEDFTVRAAAQKDATIRALEKMIAEARERAAAAALRLENERLQAQLDALKRQQPAAAPTAKPAVALSEQVREREEPAAVRLRPTLASSPNGSIARAPVTAPTPVQQALPVAPAANETAATGAPTLRIGVIAERLGFALTAEQLRGLGIEPASRERGATLYHEHQFPQICDALARRVAGAKAAHMQPLAA